MSVLCIAELDAQVSITIDTSIVYQRMDGFGTSVRVFNDPHIIGGAVSDPIADGLVISAAEEDVILDLLYVDLGLTRARSATGEDGAIENPNDNSDPYDTDTTQFDFAWKKMDAHIDYISRVVPRGVDTWFPSTIKLENWMTEAEPAEYAEWAFAIIKRWRDQGVELPLYSIVNEPGYAFSGIWSGEFLRDCIKLLGPKLDSAGMITRIVIPDDLNANEAITRAQIIMADSTARSYVAALGYHLYGGSAANKTAMMQLGLQYDVPVWMTEYSRPDAFDWGNVIHDEIANYGASAVDNMWGFWGAQGNGDANYISLNYTGNTYTGYTIEKHYYVTGQYSKYVRPGARRVEAISSNTDVRVTSYIDGTGMAIVVHNNHGVPQTVDFTTNGLNAGVLGAVRTSLTENWAVLPNTTVSNGMFTATLPPNSITTFYTEQLSTAVEQIAAATASMNVYPNPAHDRITVRLSSATTTPAELLFTNAIGQVVVRRAMRLAPGKNEMIFDVDDLAPGMYQLLLRTASGEVAHTKLLLIGTR